MVRRLLRAVGISLAALLVIGLLLYAAGLRVVLDGGGQPYLAFVRSARAQADQVARHRESQRTQTGITGVPAEAPRSIEVPGATPEQDPAAAPLAVANPAAAPYWTDFRGPRRDGHYDERPILTTWPAAGLKPIWRQPIGGGYASFVVEGGRAFTIEQRGNNEVVAAYDVATGRELWTNAWAAAFREFMGGDGPRATPTWHEGLIFALGGEGELRCLDAATGRLVWRTNILTDAGANNLQWGMAASPLIVDDTVVVLPGGPNGQSIVAYDRRSGKRIWGALDDAQSYSSPMLVTLGGVRQLLVFSASRLMGVTPDRGEVLWEHPWKTQADINASQPLLVGPNRVFVSTGYGVGAAVLEVTPAGRRFEVREVWRNIRMKNQFTSSVLHDGFVYGLDESILACVDVATGELKWKGGRYGYGQVALASGHLVVLTEGGDLALVKATPVRHEEVVRFPVFDGKTWSHPAFSGGFLIARNISEMAAFDLRLP